MHIISLLKTLIYTILFTKNFLKKHKALPGGPGRTDLHYSLGQCLGDTVLGESNSGLGVMPSMVEFLCTKGPTFYPKGKSSKGQTLYWLQVRSRDRKASKTAGYMAEKGLL